MELRHLRYFVAVAEAEHFGKAAEQLHVSQSPLSRQIAQLEEEVGALLFTRAGRGVKLSPAGRAAILGRLAWRADDEADPLVRSLLDLTRAVHEV